MMAAQSRGLPWQWRYQRLGMKARGKRFLARFCWLLWGEVHPAGRRCPRQGENPGSGRRRAGGPGPWAAQAEL